MNATEAFETYRTGLENQIQQTQMLINNFGDFDEFDFQSNSEINFNDFHFTHVIYVIQLLEPFQLSSENIKNGIRQAKLETNIKYPQVNSDSGNQMLYVGKSLTSFRTRFKQHMGLSSRSTYALHLDTWEEIFGRNVNLRLHYKTLQNMIGDFHTETLIHIENSLHEHYRPVLGRVGSRN